MAPGTHRISRWSLLQAARLQEQGLAPEPEPEPARTIAENKIHDISATPEADRRVVWEPVISAGVIIRWQTVAQRWWLRPHAWHWWLRHHAWR